MIKALYKTFPFHQLCTNTIIATRNIQLNACCKRSLMASYPSNTSPLLSLPAELKNIIFRYALTARKGQLRYKIGTKRNRNSGRFILYEDCAESKCDNFRPAAFNQLKLVNRQLFTQTADLELQFNEISFPVTLTDRVYMNPANRTIKLAKAMNDIQVSWLSTIVIRGPSGPYFDQPRRAMPGIERAVQLIMQSKIAIHNPGVAIRYFCPRFNHFSSKNFSDKSKYLPHKLIQYGVYFNAAVRGDYSYVENQLLHPYGNGMTEEVHEYCKSDWMIRRELRSKLKILSNFRVFPATLEEDIDDFQERYEIDIFELGPGRFNMWKAAIKQWIREGI